MQEKVLEEEVQRFDALYHVLLVQSRDMPIQVPQELKELASLDISIINLLAQHPQSAPGMVSTLLNLPKSTVTSALQRLEQKQILEKQKSMEDKRSYVLVLTPKGRALQHTHIQFEQEYFSYVLSRFPTHQKRVQLMEFIETFLRTGQ